MKPSRTGSCAVAEAENVPLAIRPDAIRIFRSRRWQEDTARKPLERVL